MEKGEEKVEMGYGGGFGMPRLVGCGICGYPGGEEVSIRNIRRVVSPLFSFIPGPF